MKAEVCCPTAWLNLASCLGSAFPLPRIGSGSKTASSAELEKIYSKECVKIELRRGEYAKLAYIPIPIEVLEQYRKYRPTPLTRARGLESALGYSGRIYFKREDLNPTGSHKPNTALPQAFYAKQQGLSGLVTDTGAGQWGAALAMACRSLGLDCTVFMTRNSYDEKPYRRYLMQMAGAKVIPSPCLESNWVRRNLHGDESSCSLGIGMGEAMDMVKKAPDRRLALGCMSYYAALHQTVVGQELVQQLKLENCVPDVLIGCVGGGTNLFGFAAPFLRNKFKGSDGPTIMAAESANVPVLTQGEYRYDHADYFGLTPQVLMYTLGHKFIPPQLHSGGLRYHGKSPILSLAVRRGLIQPIAISQEEAFAAGQLFFDSEGIVAAPESNHAIAGTIRAVNENLIKKRNSSVVFCLSGTGYLDLEGYAKALGLPTEV